MSRYFYNNRIKLVFKMQEEEFNRRDEDGNFVIRAANEMASQVNQLIFHSEKLSSTMSTDMIVLAKKIAENAVIIGKFVQHMSDICAVKGYVIIYI